MHSVFYNFKIFAFLAFTFENTKMNLVVKICSFHKNKDDRFCMPFISTSFGVLAVLLKKT